MGGAVERSACCATPFNTPEIDCRGGRANPAEGSEGCPARLFRGFDAAILCLDPEAERLKESEELELSCLVGDLLGGYRHN